MKKVSKILAVLLSVCLLFSLTTITAWGAGAQPSSEYVRPDQHIAEMTAKPRIDGEIEAAWKNVTSIEFNEAALKKSGLIWTHSEDGLIFEPLPDVSGTAYVGYDANYFYFALEVNQAEHINDQSDNSLLWAGDCLQIQIGPDASLIASDTDPGTCNRYELGFALSTFTKGRRLGYKWFPEPGENLKSGAKQDMAKADGDYYYYVAREGTKTIYEIALKYSFIGRSEAFAKGDVIPFSFALHINEANPVSDQDNGSFMEWAQGVVGGTLEKNIASGARLTLGIDGPDTPPVNTTKPPVGTTQPPVGTTKPPVGQTTTAGGNTDSTTKAPVGNTDSTTKAPVGNTDSTTKAPVATQPGETTAATTTTEATTTTPPQIVGVEEFYSDDKATDVEDTAILDEIKKNFEGKDVIVKSYVPENKKFSISIDALEGIYVKNADGTYAAIEGEEEDIEGEDGSITTWLVYDVSSLEEGQTLYVVKTAPATTTTTEATTAAATTEPSKAADATTTAPNADDDKDGEKEGSNWWIWLLVALAVVAIAIILFIILKKKKDDDEEEETEAPAEE